MLSCPKGDGKHRMTAKGDLGLEHCRNCGWVPETEVDLTLGLSKAQRRAMQNLKDVTRRHHKRLTRVTPTIILDGNTEGARTARRILEFRGEGDNCHYCHEELTDHTRTIDHMIPKSHGGTNDLINLVLACYACNSSKGNKTYTDFIHEMANRQRKGTR